MKITYKTELSFIFCFGEKTDIEQQFFVVTHKISGHGSCVGLHKT